MIFGEVFRVIILARREDVTAILDEFDRFHQRLQFTVEMEIEGKLKFLDMIRRKNDSITTEWFSKDVNGRYLDFISISPFIHKNNTIVVR